MMLRALSRSCAALRRTRAPGISLRAGLSSTAKDSAEGLEGVDLDREFEVNHLDGKETRALIHSAFASRAMASVKYDYFAQRAELECELDAAATFKAMTETAKQQAMGYLELMEDYGDCDFGLTVENLESAAKEERANAEERFPKAAEVAASEELDQVDQWFQDMAEASLRASERLDLTVALMDSDTFQEEGDEEAEEAVPSKTS